MSDTDRLLAIDALACIAAGVFLVLAESELWLLYAWLAFICAWLIDDPEENDDA